MRSSTPAWKAACKKRWTTSSRLRSRWPEPAQRPETTGTAIPVVRFAVILARGMSTEIPPSRSESGAATKLQILATEHWSLLATRSLTYNESLARVNIFLAILSGAVIALALIAQADRFGPTFIAIAIPVLLIVFYAGIATITRLTP